MIIVKDHHLTTVFPAVCDFLCAWFSASTSVISKWKCLLENCKKVFEFPLSQITTCLLVAVGRHSQLPAVFILFWLILLSLLSRFRFSIKFIDDFYPAKVPLCLKKRDEQRRKSSRTHGDLKALLQYQHLHNWIIVCSHMEAALDSWHSTSFSMANGYYIINIIAIAIAIAIAIVIVVFFYCCVSVFNLASHLCKMLERI